MAERSGVAARQGGWAGVECISATVQAAAISEWARWSLVMGHWGPGVHSSPSHPPPSLRESQILVSSSLVKLGSVSFQQQQDQLDEAAPVALDCIRPGCKPACICTRRSPRL